MATPQQEMEAAQQMLNAHPCPKMYDVFQLMETEYQSIRVKTAIREPGRTHAETPETRFGKPLEK